MNDHSNWGSPLSIVRLEWSFKLGEPTLHSQVGVTSKQVPVPCHQLGSFPGKWGMPAESCTDLHSTPQCRLHSKCWIPWTSFLWSHLGQTRNKLPLRNWLSWNVVNVSWVLICLVWTAATVVKCVLHGLILESIFFTHGDTCKSGILLCVANVQRFNSDGQQLMVIHVNINNIVGI